MTSSLSFVHRWSWSAILLLVAACGGVATPSVTSVTVSVALSTLLVDQTTQAEAQVAVVGGAAADVIWSSSDTLVATVDASGLVTGVGAGSATITATSVVDPTVSGGATVEVADIPAVTDLSVQGPAYMRIGRQVSATLQITVVGGADPTVGWSSSNDAVATVNANGLITAVSAGSAFIIATSVFDDTAIASHNVQVVADAWLETDQDLPTPVSRPAGLVVDGSFYIIGGEGGIPPRTDAVQVYDPQTDDWDLSLDPLPAALSNLCAAELGGSIYVQGGFTEAAVAVDTLYRFDLVDQSWEEMADDPLPEDRHAQACAVHDGLLYLFGGESVGGGSLLEPVVYDPEAPAGSRWSSGLATPPTNVRYGAAVTVGEYIYLAGGLMEGALTDLAAVSRYHPATDTWDSLPPLQTARGGAGAWSDGRYLYVAGGGWSSFLSSVEAYDLADDLLGSWVYAEAFSHGRRTFAYGYDPVFQVSYVAAGWAGTYLGSPEIGRDLAPLP